jgi:hypothetical protein
MRILVLGCGIWLSCSTLGQADLYQWTDANGVIHVVDEAGAVPEAYRAELKVYRSAQPPVSADVPAAFLSPSRTYTEHSQGAFAQKLALDLGLITHSGQDALGPLSGAGIRPAGSWKVSDPLTPEAVYEVLAAARRAADAKRLPLSADGAEAVVRQAAAAFLPPPPPVQTPLPPAETYAQEPEVVIIEQAPPQVIEVVREPYYVPVPLVTGFSHFHHHHHHGARPQREPLPPSPPPPDPPASRLGPTHMPFGSKALPFGASHPTRRPSHPTHRFLR